MALTLVALLALASNALASSYSRSENIIGKGFLDAFSYDSIPDPTEGRVNYVDGATAASQNLTFYSSDTFILRADAHTVLSASGPGRNSVRLLSNKKYTNGVTLANIRHMPQGCGTWPAFWSIGDDYSQGEIDILEGVNDQGPNSATVWTDAGCTMPLTRNQTGTVESDGLNCDVNGSDSGCYVLFPTQNSYGPAFNQNGGGWFAMERTNTFIKILGTPTAYYPNTSCNIASHFGGENIIINLTFCGSWAGDQSVYSSAGCPGTCVDYVNNNPTAFANAYFDFAWLNIYV